MSNRQPIIDLTNDLENIFARFDYRLAQIENRLMNIEKNVEVLLVRNYFAIDMRDMGNISTDCDDFDNEFN